MIFNCKGRHSNLNMEAIRYPEALETTYQIIWCHRPKIRVPIFTAVKTSNLTRQT